MGPLSLSQDVCTPLHGDTLSKSESLSPRIGFASQTLTLCCVPSWTSCFLQSTSLLTSVCPLSGLSACSLVTCLCPQHLTWNANPVSISEWVLAAQWTFVYESFILTQLIASGRNGLSVSHILSATSQMQSGLSVHLCIISHQTSITALTIEDPTSVSPQFSMRAR